MPVSRKPLSYTEFVTLLAFMVSIVAMATDVMLPALQEMGNDLGVTDPNDAQLVVTSLFVGFAVGQFLAGPLSDRYGRRPIIIGGYVVFVVGCGLSLIADSLDVMLAGRVLQGVGAAAPRVVSISLIRDGYEGRAMAKVMSVIMSVFILVPALAPSIGQGVMVFGGWPATFVLLLLMAVTACLWFGLRQPETLAPENQRPLTLSVLASGCAEAMRNPVVIGFTAATGCVFGAFLSYLSSAQQIFEQTFGVGDDFPLYFAAAALSIGAASVLNSLLVMRYGMRLLSTLALSGLVTLSAMFLILLLVTNQTPVVWQFMAWIMPSFFCVGLLFGNLNALAMEPLGHMAGLGSALVGSVSTVMSIPAGWLIGNLYDGTVIPMVSGFMCLGAAALVIVLWAGPYVDRPDLSRAKG